MKNFILLCLFLFVGVAGWQIGQKLSSDAVSMAVGVLFGCMAGIPAALLVLVSQRSTSPAPPPASPPAPANPTLIVLAGAPRLPSPVRAAAEAHGGVAEWDGAMQRWTIVDPDSGRVLATQRKQLPYNH